VNSTEKKYALERVDAIKRQRLATLQKTHPATRLSCEEKIHRLRSGNFAVDSTEKKHRWWYEWIVFAGDEKGSYADAYFPLAEAVEEEARKVKDLIMLGDGSEALRLLSEFANGSVAK
jgi:hypothetical protein